MDRLFSAISEDISTPNQNPWTIIALLLILWLVPSLTAAFVLHLQFDSASSY